MSRLRLLPAFAAAALVASAVARDEASLGELDARERRIVLGMSPRPPLPPDPTNAVADDPRAVRLGQALFFDPRFSADGKISCATCHDPSTRFTDGAQRAHGIGEAARHTPTVLDSARLRWLFWDGRADSLWMQALGPIENPVEHGASRLEVAHLVGADPGYRTAYEQLFGALPPLDRADRFPPAGMPDDPDPARAAAWNDMEPRDRDAIDAVFADVGKAIAAYERRLLTPDDSPFDQAVAALRAGDVGAADAAMSPAARRGLRLFVGKANCRLCHSGPDFSDGEFHSTGIPPLDGGIPNDAGRFEGLVQLAASPFTAAGPHSDDREGAAAEKVRSTIRTSESWGQFRTPPLRGVAETAPYMHEGQIATLEEVLRHYSTLERAVLPGHHQEVLLVPLHLSEGEIADLVAFLGALTPSVPDPALLRPPGDSAQREDSISLDSLNAGASGNPRPE